MVVAMSYAGVFPASTGPLAVAVAHPTLVRAAPAVVAAAPHVYSAGPAVVAPAPHVYSAGPAVVAAGPAVTYTTGAKVVHKLEPVEQHGYQIAY